MQRTRPSRQSAQTSEQGFTVRTARCAPSVMHQHSLAPASNQCRSAAGLRHGRTVPRLMLPDPQPQHSAELALGHNYVCTNQSADMSMWASITQDTRAVPAERRREGQQALPAVRQVRGGFRPPLYLPEQLHRAPQLPLVPGSARRRHRRRRHALRGCRLAAQSQRRSCRRDPRTPGKGVLGPSQHDSTQGGCRRQRGTGGDRARRNSGAARIPSVPHAQGDDDL